MIINLFKVHFVNHHKISGETKSKTLEFYGWLGLSDLLGEQNL